MLKIYIIALAAIMNIANQSAQAAPIIKTPTLTVGGGSDFQRLLNQNHVTNSPSPFVTGAVDLALTAIEAAPVAALLVGGAIAYVTLSDPNPVRLMMGATPPPASIPPNQNTTTSVPSGGHWCAASWCQATSATDACQNGYDGNSTACNSDGNSARCGRHGACTDLFATVYRDTNSPPTCPSGTTYQSTSDTCLVPPINWPDDGVPTYQPTTTSGGSQPFTPSPNQPTSRATDTPTGPISTTGVDENGNLVSETVNKNAQNGIDYQRQTQTTSQTTGQPQVTTTQISTDTNGTITSASTIVNNNTTISNVNNTTNNKLDTTGLNQEATQLQVLDAVKGKTTPDVSGSDSPIHDAMQSTIDSVNGANTTVGSAATNNPFSTVSPANYWSFSKGECAVVELGKFRDHSITTASFCAIYDSVIRAVMVWIIGVLGMLHAYSVWSETVREM